MCVLRASMSGYMALHHSLCRGYTHTNSNDAISAFGICGAHRFLVLAEGLHVVVHAGRGERFLTNGPEARPGITRRWSSPQLTTNTRVVFPEWRRNREAVATDMESHLLRPPHSFDLKW